MKKVFFYCLGILSSPVFGQITYEHSYFNLFSQNGIGQEFFLTNLGNNDYKYVIYDYDSAFFSMYNLDHTPFMLHIQIPVVSNQLTNTYYRLGYISTTLFDCDSTNIEYAMMLNTPRLSEHPNFAVYRTDGTVLFSKDSVGTLFCVGCGSGSYELHRIMSTSMGTKLYLFQNHGTDSLEYLIYDLCGLLPDNVSEHIRTDAFVDVFPNPSTGEVTFQIVSPSSFQQYDLTIFNSAFQSIDKTKIDELQSKVVIDGKNLPSGVYFYSLQNKDKVYQSGKFMLSK
jgi:hypothetical protein